MKAQAQRTKPIPKPFEPVTLTITFDDDEELSALRKLAGYDMTVPKYLADDGKIGATQQRVMQVILGKIHYSLSNIKEI